MSINLNKKSNRDTSSKASSFLRLVASFDFIVALVITRCVFDYTLPVTQLLQNKSIDINHGIHLIQSLKDHIVAMRNNIDFYHLEWYNKALELASQVDVSEAKPRTCGRQINRGNTPADTASEYFKRTITIPMIDHLNLEINQRFDSSTITAYHEA